jgi:hypothetical protein
VNCFSSQNLLLFIEMLNQNFQKNKRKKKDKKRTKRDIWVWAKGNEESRSGCCWSCGGGGFCWGCRQRKIVLANFRKIGYVSFLEKKKKKSARENAPQLRCFIQFWWVFFFSSQTLQTFIHFWFCLGFAAVMISSDLFFSFLLCCCCCLEFQNLVEDWVILDLLKFL